jgi:hypothetical protein
MLKLFPLKIPTDSDIGLRFKAAAEAAGLAYWELLGRLLKMWDARSLEGQLPLFPPPPTIDERFDTLEEKMGELRDMVSNMVSIGANIGAQVCEKVSIEEAAAAPAPEPTPAAEAATGTEDTAMAARVAALESALASIKDILEEKAQGRQRGKGSKKPKKSQDIPKNKKPPKEDNMEIAKKRIKELHGAGKTVREIGSILETEGIATSRGKRVWAASSIFRLLQTS